ncbi:MAG TPA: hypothetical protein VHE35_12105 [Kofleriaceae bacterium]|nr:hypothetical protein [Kofleriaceae bacterium]
MTLTVRRVVARMFIAAAVTVAAVTVLRRCQGSTPREIVVTVRVDAVPGVQSVDLELWRGREVVGHAERSYRDGLNGPLVLRAPALGRDGEVRIWLETDEGARRVRKPLVAPAGSEVEIRVGE